MALPFPFVSVIVPALNEAASLGELYQRTSAALHDQPFEFLVIDDGSTDSTDEVIARLQATHGNIGYLRHFRNHGKSLALMQGFRLARGDVAVTMDADLQDHPESIPAFLSKLSEGFDLVNGYRTERQDEPAKILVSQIFNYLTSRLTSCPLHDINCGFKAMTRRAYKGLALRGDLHRLIPALVAARGLRITEIPVPHSPRKHGTSRYSLLRHRGLLDIITVAASNSTQTRPFHAFSEVAGLFLVTGLLTFSGWAAWFSQGNGTPGRSLVAEVLRASSSWFILLGTVLPLFGFTIEVLADRQQTDQWRESLIQQQILPRN